MLITHKTWERRNSSLGLLYAEDEFRYYPYCKIKTSNDLFHLEIRSKNGKRVQSRFIVTDVFDVIPLLRSASSAKIDIHLLTVPTKLANSDYALLRVVEIVEATDSEGQPAAAYRCIDDRWRIRSIICTSEEDLRNRSIAYRLEPGEY